MKVIVQYLGPIRSLLNKKEDEVDVSLRTTIYDLLKKLSAAHGKLFEGEIFEDDGKTLREGIIVTVNGWGIGRLEGLGTRLKVGDVVALLPLFAGGG